MSDPVVELRAVSKAYRISKTPKVVLEGAELEVRRGEIVGIVGPSGSGKSTLLRMLAGLERPDRGDVIAEGKSLWPAGARTYPALPRRGWAMPVFQDPVSSLDPRWPLWRTLTEPLRLRGERRSRAEFQERARTLLAEADLGHIAVTRRPGTLSVGQCQRVAILRALTGEPRLIVADEPTASLDAQSAATVCALLRRSADSGTAIVVVSHDEPRLRSYADRVLRIASGTL